MDKKDKEFQISQLVLYIGEQENRIHDLLTYHHKTENSPEVQTCRAFIQEAEEKIWKIRWNKK